jgi:hypothetical protein
MDMKRDKRVFSGAFILSLLIILLAPVFYGYYNAPPGKVFLGITGLNPVEQFYYLSVGPSQALKGEILFADKYARITPEQVIINPIANIIGLISLGFHVSLPVAFNIFRILSAIFLVTSFYYLAKQFIQHPFIQFIAVLIYCFSSGFDYHFHLFGISGIDSVDDSIVETNMFISMSGEYFLPLANALFIMVLANCYRVFFHQENKVWLCGVYLFLLGIVYIYALVSVVVILSVAALLKGLLEKRVVPTIITLLKLSLFCLPVAIYYTWLLSHFPAMDDDGWYSFPPFQVLFSTFGFGFVFALVGFFVKKKNVLKSEWYLLLWIGLTLTLIYIPQTILPIQIQLLIGLGAPLAILFATSLQALYNSLINKYPAIKLKPHAGRYAAIFALIIILISSGTNLNFYTRQFKDLNKHILPMYISSDIYKAMIWSSANISEKKTVLISRKLGFIFSSVTACTVYCGIGGDKEITPEQRNTELIMDYLKKSKIKEGRELLLATKADYIFLDKTLDKDFLVIKGILKEMYKTCFENEETLMVQLR